MSDKYIEDIIVREDDEESNKDAILIPAGLKIEVNRFLEGRPRTFNCIVLFGKSDGKSTGNRVEFEQGVTQEKIAHVDCDPLHNRGADPETLDPKNKKHSGTASLGDADTCIRYTWLKVASDLPKTFWVKVTVNNVSVYAKVDLDDTATSRNALGFDLTTTRETVGEVLKGTMDQVVKLASEPSTPGEKRFFPNGVGLISVSAEVAWSATGKIKVEVKVADVKSSGTDTAD